MNQKLLFFLFLLYGFHISAQTTFKNGYFINNENQRKECMIKDLDWKNNPIAIEYKNTIKSEPTVISINEIKEFGISEESRYLRSLVKIDRSSEKTTELTDQRNPVFNEELLFLKVLVEGKANLYLYEDGNLRRFFFNVDDKPIEQLVFKTYLLNPNLARNNNLYKQQLSNELKSERFESDTFEKLNYEEQALTNLFVFYHESQNLMFKKYIQRKDLDRFNINIRPRIISNSLTFNNTSSSIFYMNYDNQINLSLGVEFEVFLPFNNNKWSIFLEPTYQSFSDEKIQNYQSGTSPEIKHAVTYSSIDFHFGLRYYSFLNEDSKLFFNLAAVPNYVLNGTYEITNSTNFYSYTAYSFDLSIVFNASIGFGYKFKDRYSLEFRYNTPRGLTDNYVVWDTKYNTSALIFGYTIF